jgi:galactokinase
MSIETLSEEARAVFAERFGGKPRFLARAPGRVELLGNHTDYNGGLVLAAAIDRFTVVAGRAIDEPIGRAHSVNFNAGVAFPCARAALESEPSGGWPRYVRAVHWALTERSAGRGGFEAVITGEVPLGAGLSSSASLQAALGCFLIASGVVDPPPGDTEETRWMTLARWLQRGENEFVGVASGLLDQFSVLFGKQGRALALDCRDQSFERLSLGSAPPAIVVCDSKTSRRLADGLYNRRRNECESVVARFRSWKGDQVRWLRDIQLDELLERWDDLPEVDRRRARHVLSENERVRRGAEALRAGDLAAFGRLMTESHASSRDDFENSAPALEALMESAAAAPGFLGGKLSGAGWAGCTVNLVAPDRADDFAEAVTIGYERRRGIRPEIHVCHAAEGARAEALDATGD